METLERIARALEGIESALQILASKQHGERYADELIKRYGYFVDKSTAAGILGVNRATVYAMIADGRLVGACKGKRVDVRSIVAYIGSPDDYTKKVGEGGRR